MQLSMPREGGSQRGLKARRGGQRPPVRSHALRGDPQQAWEQGCFSNASRAPHQLIGKSNGGAWFSSLRSRSSLTPLEHQSLD